MYSPALTPLATGILKRREWQAGSLLQKGGGWAFRPQAFRHAPSRYWTANPNISNTGRCIWDWPPFFSQHAIFNIPPNPNATRGPPFCQQTDLNIVKTRCSLCSRSRLAHPRPQALHSSLCRRFVGQLSVVSMGNSSPPTNPGSLENFMGCPDWDLDDNFDFDQETFSERLADPLSDQYHNGFSWPGEKCDEPSSGCFALSGSLRLPHDLNGTSTLLPQERPGDKCTRTILDEIGRAHV